MADVLLVCGLVLLALYCAGAIGLAILWGLCG